MKVPLSYSKKLLFLLLVVSLIPLISISVIFYSDKIETETDILKNKLNLITETGSNKISDIILNQKNNVLTIAQTENVISATKKLSNPNTDKNDYFENQHILENEFSIFSNSNPQLQNFIISDPKNGKILIYTDLAPPSNDFQSQNHYQEALNGKVELGHVFFSSNPTPNEFGIFEKNIPIYYISAPIEGEVGIEGILTVCFNLLDINSISQSNDYFTINSFIVNSEGYFLSKPKIISNEMPSDHFKTRPELKLQTITQSSNQFTEIFGSANTEKNVLNLDGYENQMGQFVIGSISPIKETTWSYITEIEKSEAFLGISSLQIMILSIISIVLISMTGLAFYFTQTFTAPIKNLQSATEQIIKGNFDIKTGIKSEDDIGQLSQNFDFMINNLKDMTDIEQQLSIQQNLRKALDESSIVSIIDKNGKIKYANDKFCKVSKYSKEELIGKRQDILRSTKIHPASFYADLWNVISTGKIWKGEICNTAKDGTLFWNDVTVIPFVDKDGKISEYVSVRNDITEQKNLTQKLIHAERFAAIGELSSRMSHDIRNPLSIIQNEFELLKRKKILDEKQIERVSSSISRITHQLNDVLDYLRDTPLELQSFNLSNLLSKVLASLNIPSGVKIKTSGDEIFMFGDESKMNVALVNLIYNAIQAVEDSGEIDVSVSKT
ncbi:MAG: PAS domain-containing protein, partial [Nitrosopumilus sp.]|nr:PAS domain-containing protein [Nitrosopumilus sp.]